MIKKIILYVLFCITVGLSACNPIDDELWKLNKELAVIRDPIWSPIGNELALVEQVNSSSYSVDVIHQNIVDSLED